MDPFSLIVAGGLGAFIIALLLLGFFHPKSGADVLDWKPTRSAEVEFQNEIDDTAQMIAAQNELRRRHGKAERTEADVQEEVRRHKAEMAEYTERYWTEQREQGRLPGKEDL